MSSQAAPPVRSSSARVGDRPGRGPLLGRRHQGARVELRSDLDDPGVTPLRRRRLLEELGVDVGRRGRDPLLGGEPGLEPAVDQALEGQRRQLVAGVVQLVDLRLRGGLGQLSGHHRRADLAFRLVQAPGFDAQAIAQLVLADGLAVHAADRGEVLVVPGQGAGDDEDQHGQDDDDPEADVEEEVPPVLAFPGGALGALDDGFGFEGHGLGGFLLAWPVRAGV